MDGVAFEIPQALVGHEESMVGERLGFNVLVALVTARAVSAVLTDPAARRLLTARRAARSR